MKKILYFLPVACILMQACKKSGSDAPAPTDQTQYYVSSVRNFLPGTQNIDSFVYNGAHLITRYAQYVFDSTSGAPEADSLFFDFTYSGSNTEPDSYIFSQPSQSNFSELHQLSYDGQQRVTRDSCPSRPDFVTYYSYPSSNLAGMVQFSNGFGLDNQLDTLIFSNGNMTTELIYFPNDAQTADSLEGTLKFNYSTYGNPIYHSGIAETIGHLLFIMSFDGFNDFIDFNSKRLYNSVTDFEPGSSPRTITYTLFTDGKGRIWQSGYTGYPISQYHTNYYYY